jgi:hypothetical protein
MRNLSDGIELPIIPEDLMDTAENPRPGTLETPSRWSNCCFKTDADLMEWIIQEWLLLKCPES